jgi:hypothetical protein
MSEKKKSALRWAGFGLGALASLPISALSFMGNQWLGLPFIAFNLLDYLTRVLPRLMVFVGIDRLLQGSQQVTTPNLGAIDAIFQPFLAVLLVAVLSGVFGLILTNIGRKKAERAQKLPLYGLIGGAVLWVLFALMVNYLGYPPAGQLWSIVGLGVLTLLWGVFLGWTLKFILFSPPAEAETDLSRRRALYIAGTSAAALVAGGLGFLSPRKQAGEQAQVSGGETSGGGSIFKAEADATPPSIDVIGVAETNGPAASPSLSDLTGRIMAAPGTRPEITSARDFYNIDINTDPPELNENTWDVAFKGLVDRPTRMSIADFKSFPEYSQLITIGCISNAVGGGLVSTAKWTGVRLRDVLSEIGLSSNAQELYITAADGFYESVSMEDMMDPRTLLVYEMNNQPLPYEHGFPLRIYIPNRFGMKQPKWITTMEAINEEGPGYWVDRGWSAEAIVRTTSVIDNVAVDAIENDRVPIGGIAWAGARGISKIEVQVDDGEWAEAQLRTPALSPLTWIQWRYDWPVESGGHTARVRATDGNGDPQVSESTGRRPDGSTGIDEVDFTIS